ncbi:MAG: COG3014 family protein [bacterium]
MDVMKRGLVFYTGMACIGAWCLLLAYGCSTSVWVHYPMRVSRARMYLVEGRDQLAVKELDARVRSGQDQLLHSMETGMVYYLEGDYGKCIPEWLDAEKMMERFDYRPVVSIREVSEQIGTLAVNDYLITYQGMTYERVLVHLYLALAYLMKNDQEGARIELKKAEQVQKKAFDKWQEKRAAQLRDAPEAKAAEDKVLEVYKTRYGMPEHYSSFSLNPLAYYLSGWLYEKEGYPDEALIDYRRLRDLGVRQEYLGPLVSQLEKRMHSSWGSGEGQAGKEAGDLFVIHQQGLIPELEELRVPVEIKGQLVIMAIPVYAQGAPSPMHLTVTVGQERCETQELVDVYSLALESLRERIPGMVTRQVARMLVKATASREASRKGGTLASMVTTIYNVVSERADLRSWLTIPLSIQVGRLRLPPGRHVVHLDLVEGAGSMQVEVDIQPGEYHILDVRTIGSRMVAHLS